MAGIDLDRKKEHMRQVLLSPGVDGYWVVEFPSLPGCISQGKTREEALEYIKETIQAYIETLIEDGEPVTEDVPLEVCRVAA